MDCHYHRTLCESSTLLSFFLTVLTYIRNRKRESKENIKRENTHGSTQTKKKTLVNQCPDEIILNLITILSKYIQYHVPQLHPVNMTHCPIFLRLIQFTLILMLETISHSIGFSKTIRINWNWISIPSITNVWYTNVQMSHFVRGPWILHRARATLSTSSGRHDLASWLLRGRWGRAGNIAIWSNIFSSVRGNGRDWCIF